MVSDQELFAQLKTLQFYMDVTVLVKQPHTFRKHGFNNVSRVEGNNKLHVVQIQPGGGGSFLLPRPVCTAASLKPYKSVSLVSYHYLLYIYI